MGLHLSKNTATEFQPPIQELINEELQFRSTLNSFQEALSLESTGCLLEMNEEAFKIILDCKEDIWENRHLFQLVQEFFHNSLETLNLCTALERCLRKESESHLTVQAAIQEFEEKDNGMIKEKKYNNLMEKLRGFKAAGDPFSKEEISELLKTVYKNRVRMLGKLQVQKSKLDKKLKHVKTCRKASKIIFIATSAALLFCSVLAAALAAPPVAAAVAAATAIPLESMRRWTDSVFKRHEDKLSEHKKIIDTMEVGTCIAIKDLTDILALVNRLEKDIESLFQSTTDFSVRQGDETLKIGLDENKKKLGVFKKSVNNLSDMVDKCSKGLIRARTILVGQITKPPLT